MCMVTYKHIQHFSSNFKQQSSINQSQKRILGQLILGKHRKYYVLIPTRPLYFSWLWFVIRLTLEFYVKCLCFLKVHLRTQVFTDGLYLCTLITSKQNASGIEQILSKRNIKTSIMYFRCIFCASKYHKHYLVSFFSINIYSIYCNYSFFDTLFKRALSVKESSWNLIYCGGELCWISESDWKHHQSLGLQPTELSSKVITDFKRFTVIFGIRFFANAIIKYF